MRRIQAGIEQFAEPAVIATNHDDGDRRAYPAHGAPMPTRSTKIGDGVACPPFLLDRYDYQGSASSRLRPADADAMGTVTGAGRTVRTLLAPPGAFIAKHYTPRRQWAQMVKDAAVEPLGAITSWDHHSVVTSPLLVPAGGTWNDDAASVEEPMRTRLTRDTDAVLTPAPGELAGTQPWITVLRNHADAASIDDPLATVATGTERGGHQALTVPPNATLPGGQAAVAGAFIQKHHGGLSYRAIAHMTKSVEDPLPGVVARPNLSLVIPYRKGRAKTTDEPLHTVATRESAALLADTGIDPAGIDIADCRFRMLKPREHGRAQRFTDDYRVFGNQSEQTMGFGNAVSSNVPQWLGAIIRDLLS